MSKSGMGRKAGSLFAHPLRWLLLVGVLTAFGSCFEASALKATKDVNQSHTRPGWMTVVVALDGVRWQEIFGGVDRERARRLSLPTGDGAKLMPNLYRIIQDHGCALGGPDSHHVISASGPNFVSLPGYTEIFTGRAPTECADNDCKRVRQRTVADDAAALDRDVGRVAVITSWPKIELAASAEPDGMVVSAGRSAGTNHQVFHRDPRTEKAYERGRRATPDPGFGGFRPDRYTADLALSYLASERPRFLFVGLGETDEYAHQNDYRHYLAALRQADVVIGAVDELLHEAELEGTSTLLFVTSDHGRAGFVHHGAAYPESARTWLVAAGSAVKARGFVNSPESRRLADLAPTMRWLWGIADPPATDLNLVASAKGSVLAELF